MSDSISLCIVVPCFNEEETLQNTVKELGTLVSELIDKKLLSEKSKVLFVDDGSKDLTWQKIQKISTESQLFKGLKLSRNFGHQNAVLAGMEHVFEDFECVISIDADLQDDIHVIEKMVLAFNEGFDVVYGARSGRKKDSFFKKFTASLFYKLMSWMKIEVVPQHADFRLVSKRVIAELKNYSEVNLFLRSLFPVIGFKSTTTFYERKAREFGESKYPLFKMLSFAWTGITSFSTMPLRWVSIMGFFTFFTSIILSIYTLIAKYLGKTVLGWSSTVLIIIFFGGIQLLSVGIIGEYIGKIYKEVKRRPRYIKDEEI